jgi:hypothetical protein
MTVSMKSTSLWDVTPCSLVEVYRRFLETYEYCLHFQGRRVGQVRSKQQAGECLLVASDSSSEMSAKFRQTVPVRRAVGTSRVTREAIVTCSMELTTLMLLLFLDIFTA